MSRERKNSSEKYVKRRPGGFKPLNEGYSPSFKKGYKPVNGKTPKAPVRPAPPKGGSGESG